MPPLLPPGTRSGSRHLDRPAGAGVRGWKGQTQILSGRGRGGERELYRRKRGGVPPPLPERAAPGSKTPVVRQNMSLECDITVGSHNQEAS